MNLPRLILAGIIQMILETQEYAFNVEEDLLATSKEPQHQKIIRALLSDNPRLFMQLLGHSKIGNFSLPAYKVISDGLNLSEENAKAEFEKIFNQKFSEVLRDSKVEGRFFARDEQIGLHNYAQHQYFEDKSRMKIGDCIIDAYKDILKRISHIDDLVYFIDFVLHLFLRENFDFVHLKCKEVLLAQDSSQSDLQIVKVMQTCNEEDRLIIKYCFFVIVSSLGRKVKLPVLQNILEEIRSALKQKPYKDLCRHCIYLDPFTFVDSIIYLEKNPRQIIEYDFKANECRLNSEYLHPDLRCHEIFGYYFRKLKNLEQLIEKYEIIAHSAKVEDNRVLLGINYYLLSYDVDIGYEYTMKINNKTISEYIDFLHILTERISSQFVVIQEQPQDQFYNIKYACKAFELFVNLNKIRHARSEPFVYEHLIITWARLFAKWQGINQLKVQKYFQNALESFFFLFSSIEREQEFPNLGNFESELSKALFELLTRLETYPRQSSAFKGIKSIIFRWSLQLLPESEELKNIVRKFMDCFFADELKLKVLPRQDVFETPAICKFIKKTIGTSILENISRKYQLIDSQKINSPLHPAADSHINFFNKITLLINTRIVGEHIEVFAFNIMKFYLEYAHIWPILHSFRMWILQVCKDIISTKYEEKVEVLNQMSEKLLQQIKNQTSETIEGWNNISKETVELYNEFYAQAHTQINCLRLKKNKNSICKAVYEKYIHFMLNLEGALNSFKNLKTQQSSLKQWLRHGTSVENGIYSILQQFKTTMRYALCNSNRFLSLNEQESITSILANIIWKTVESKPEDNDFRWFFISDILGFSDLKFKSTINKRQIMGPLQKYTAKLSSKMQEFMPFNIAHSIYSTIRPNYKIIMRIILDSLLNNQDQEHLWLVAQRLILPSLLINGGCIFNGKKIDKTKQQFAFGLFYDQFEKLTEVLIDNNTINQNIQIVIMLEKKKKIFSSFYDILRSKHVKIVERIRSQPEGYNRYRARNMSNDDVIQALAQMGIGRDEAEIALENIQYPDHNLAMDWIDNNTDRLDELLMNRTLERTRQQAGRNQMRNEPEVESSQIQPLSYDRFYEQEKLIKLSKSWIVVVFKKLFKHEQNVDSETLKNILFMFMDSLKPDYMLKQYNNLNGKIYQEIDELNKQQKISNQIILLLSILEGSFAKTEKAKVDFYAKAINLKIISYLPRIQSQKAINQVFSILNATLPVFNADNITPELESYLTHLLDLVLKYRNSEKSQCEIMLKIAKTGKEQLMQRITRNLNIFFKENLIKQSTFTLLNIILASDKQLSNVNAELDLKTFLYERYKHRLASFNPFKEHVLQIDINEFQKSFPKYDRGSAIYTVSKQMLSKKKNKNKLLFFDCRAEKNEFHYSHFGKCNFISYPLKDHFKTIIRSLLITLFETKEREAQEQMLTDLFKLLYNYRILLPYTIHQTIQGKNLIDWLLFSQNQSKRKHKFLTFLTLNVNISIKKQGQGYNFISLSDYVCAKIIKSIVSSENNLVWTSFSALYLSQIRKFNEFCSSKFSYDNQETLISHYERLLPKVGPIEYMNISQFLYVHYKKRILDNLRRKYKFNTGTHESFFDRQFLNLSAFFNNIPVKKSLKPEKVEPFDIMPDQVDEEDQQSAEMLYVSHERRLFRNRHLGSEPQVQQLILPLPVPEPKEKDQEQQQMKEEPQKLEPIVLQNNQCLNFIIDSIQKYLSFEIQVASQFNLQESALPQNPIAITNFNLGFTVKVEEVFVDIDLRVKKLTGFQKRIAEIYGILVPKGDWEIKKEENNEDRHVLSLGRRLMESLSNPLEANRQTLLTLERLIHNRYQRQQAGQNAPPPRNININDIYQHLEQFNNPIVPPQPPGTEAMDIESINPGNQPNNQGQNNSSEVPVQSSVNQPLLQEPQPEQIRLQIEQLNSQNIPSVNSQPQQAENQQIVLEVQNYQPIEEQVIEEPVQPAVQIETIVDNNSSQRVGPVQIEHAVQQEENIDPVPVSNAENNQVQEPEQPPPRQRQILAMMNLPQTFLRDVGLDEEFFDSLPEDLQQEQLLTFMAQQGATINSRPGGNANNANNPPNQPQDLQSQNLAFLDSLDPQTRAQVLIEATPEFLITLPTNVRQQAQRQRSLQINRIIEEEEIQEERNYISNQSKPKAPLVYPKVFKEEFSKLDDNAAKQIFKGVFNIYPKFKLASLKILLENKHTQNKTISTVISLIRSFEQRQESKWRVNKVEIINKEVKCQQSVHISQEDIAHIRSNLLHIILQHIKIPLYKDEQFISESIPNVVYLEQLEELTKQKQNIDPTTQLISMALNYYPDLATELLKKTKDLPDQLFKRIVEGIKKEEWPNDLYDSLANFSKNERLKQIFSAEFENKTPKIQILGKLLKYKFSHLSSLKKIHEQALEYYSVNYIEFLNQIFSIYDKDTLTQIQPLLIKHKQTHFEVIKYLYQLGRQLKNEPIGLILTKPHLLDFETKKFIFRNHPKLRKQTGRRVHIEVDRTHLFQGSYNQLMNRTVRELEGRVQVAFINEPGYDAGGLRRQWFLLVSREIFNQDYALFEKSSSGSAYQPNPKSYINPDHLNYFKFIGRFIGKALVEKQLIDAYFTRAFYKMILGQELEFKDLEAQDYDFYKSMEWLKNNPIDENMFTFSYIYDNFGTHVEKELVPGGKSITVNEQNKKEYIEKYCMSKMRDDFSTQINKFLEGFHEVVPSQCIHFFEAKQLELLISGVPEVDVEDFKKNTDYSGYNPTDQIIIWFWEVVSEYSQEDLAKLVQFITGTSKIPVQGFSHLLGMNGIQRISIHRDPCDHQLPKSHTCFNQLDLPNYPSKEILKQKLGICLAWGSEGFGFM